MNDSLMIAAAIALGTMLRWLVDVFTTALRAGGNSC